MATLLVLSVLAVLLAAGTFLLFGDLEEQRGIDVKLYVETAASTFTLVAALRNVDLTINGESIDASHAGSGGWRKKLGALKDWSVSAGTVVLMDTGGATPVGDFEPAFKKLKELAQASTPGSNTIAVQIEWPDGSTDSGEAIITELSVSAPYDGVAEGSIELEGNGALVWAAAA